MNKTYFGTDGIRGIANRDPITPDFALKLGKAAGCYLRREKRHPRIVIGKDTRLSGYMIESALMSGICSMGTDVYLVGPMPTPAISFLTRSLKAAAGIVISASHNPFEDNGIKFFGADGRKLPDEVELEIEKVLAKPEIEGPVGEGVGRAYRVEDAVERYTEFARSSVGENCRLDGLRVVIDCSNGAAYEVAPALLREMGAEVITVGCEPNGTNINAGCGSTEPAMMRQTVTRVGADVGIALDGDADRVIMADENGMIVDGDDILFLWSLHVSDKGHLSGDAVVGTIMSNVGLEAALKKNGIRLIRAPVGDRYVYEKMLKEGSAIGAEPSGHVIFMDHSATGDGTVTALRVLEAMVHKGKPLSELVSGWERYPQVMRNLRFSERTPLEGDWYDAMISEAEEQLGEDHLLNLRYSGTEPFLRVTVSAASEEVVTSVCDRICERLTERLGLKISQFKV
jgi:phosphoglucosamine mutase